MSIADESGTHVWVYDIERDTITKRTFDQSRRHWFPVWTPDGQFVTFGVAGVGIFQVPADGSGEPELLVESVESGSWPFAWSVDGDVLAYWMAPNRLFLSKRGDPVPEGGLGGGEIHFSPNGRWLAYTSNETGRREVFVAPYPGLSGRRQISTEGGSQAKWAANGRELFYKNLDLMMVVDVNIENGFTHGTPRVLIETSLPERGPGDAMRCGVHPDSQRFLVTVPPPADESGPGPELRLIQNFGEELKRLVPTP